MKKRKPLSNLKTEKKKKALVQVTSCLTPHTRQAVTFAEAIQVKLQMRKV